MASKSTEKSKKQKLILLVLHSLENWNKIVIEGKPLVQSILAEKSDTNKSEQIQDLCGQLRNISDKFLSVVILIEELFQKLQSLDKLDNLSGNFLSILKIKLHNIGILSWVQRKLHWNSHLCFYEYYVKNHSMGNRIEQIISH